MKKLIVYLFLTYCSVVTAQKSFEYQPFSKPKVVGYSVLAAAGFLDGVVEAWGYGGRTAFERKYGADPYGYFGSRSYEVVREQRLKRDFYHNAEDTRVALYMTGSLVVGIGGYKSNKKWWHYALDFGIGWATKAVTKNLGMKYIKS